MTWVFFNRISMNFTLCLDTWRVWKPNVNLMIWWQTLPLDFELPTGWVLQGFASYAKHMLHSVRQPKEAVYSRHGDFHCECHHKHFIRINVMIDYEILSWIMKIAQRSSSSPSAIWLIWHHTRVRTECYPFRCQTYVGATTSRYNPSKICRCFGALGDWKLTLGPVTVSGSMHISGLDLIQNS